VLAALAVVSTPPAMTAGAPAPAVMNVTMREFAFEPATLQLTAGRPVRVVLVNRGTIAHQFDTAYLRGTAVRIVGAAVSVDAPGLGAARVDPEGTARLEFVPRQRGRYVFACTIEGHQEAGMRGTLDVR
jgi:uncharacterized cupredoxin-like copper-binding protein